MHVVLDTNVVVSGIFWGGQPLKVLQLWAAGKIAVAATPEILFEYEETIEDLRGRYEAPSLRRWQAFIQAEMKIIDPHRKVKLCRDPDDDKFLCCALSSGALYIVSGDKDLLDLKQVEEVRIVTIRKFLSELDS